MKIKLLFTIAVLATTLSGCNSTGNKREEALKELAAVEKDDNYICKTIKKTGSNFKTRRCMTKEAYEKTKKEARDAMDQLERNWQTGDEVGGL